MRELAAWADGFILATPEYHGSYSSTMKVLLDTLSDRGAATVRACAFLDKPARRAVELEANFRCFEVEDLFVVGYGLDFAGRYRNLPFVGSLKPELYR